MSALTPERLDLQNRLINSTISDRMVGNDVTAEQLIVTTEPYGDMATALAVYNSVGGDGVSRRISRRVRYRRKPLTDLLAALQDQPLNWSFDSALSDAENKSRLNAAVVQVSAEFAGCKLEIVSHSEPNLVAVSGANCPVFFGNGPIPVSAPSEDALARWNFGSSTYHPGSHSVTVETTPQTIVVDGQNNSVHRCVWSGDLRNDEMLTLSISQDQLEDYAQMLCSILVKPKSASSYNDFVTLASSLSSKTRVGVGDRFNGQTTWEIGDTGRQGIVVLSSRQSPNSMIVYGRSFLTGINKWSLWDYTSMSPMSPEDQEFDIEVEFLSISSPISGLQVEARIQPFDEMAVTNRFDPILTNATYEWPNLEYDGTGLLDTDGDNVPDTYGARLEWPISDDRTCQIRMPEWMTAGQAIRVTLSDGPYDPANTDLPCIEIVSTGGGYVMQDTAGISTPQYVGIEEIVYISADVSYNALSCHNGVYTNILPGNQYPVDPRITVTVTDPDNVGSQSFDVTFHKF